jgi:hypothetical protein
VVCQTARVLVLPETPEALVLRTDFSDDGAWDEVRAACSVPSVEGFAASLSFVSDRAFAGLTAAQIAALPPKAYRRFIFVVDTVTVTDPGRPLLVVDLLRQPGRSFRVIPAQAWSVENNLTLANMDFFEFADAAGPDGVFRGFPSPS